MRTFTILTFALVIAQATAQDLAGAWERKSGDSTFVMICTEKFFSAAVYDRTGNKFLGTCGGTYRIEKNTFVETHEFNTMFPDRIGKELRTGIKTAKNSIEFAEGAKNTWSRIDDGSPGKLSGAWLITGRMQGRGVTKITPGARRTMKILSGTRFQWIAYNVETKEFFGTGGGTYTTENGKYVEMIDFFSRDNSRVGQKLEFDFAFEQGNWRHSGLSSKGDPIDELWTRREKIGL